MFSHRVTWYLWLHLSPLIICILLIKHGLRGCKKGAHFILLSRADVVNFDDLIAAVKAGHIQAASDVFPQEPLALDHPVRGLKGFISLGP